MFFSSTILWDPGPINVTISWQKNWFCFQTLPVTEISGQKIGCVINKWQFCKNKLLSLHEQALQIIKEISRKNSIFVINVSSEFELSSAFEENLTENDSECEEYYYYGNHCFWQI